MATPCHLCQLPILQEERDLVTKSIQADDVQRIVAHIAFSRAFRLPTMLRLHSPTLDSLGNPFSPRPRARHPSSPPLPSSALECKAISAHFLRTSAEKREVRMSAAKKGLKSLATRHRRRLLLNQEETELVMRPVLPWHIPLHGCCA